MQCLAATAALLQRCHALTPLRDTNSPRILILEDNWLQAQELADQVRRLGLEPVGPHSEPGTALELLDDGKIDGALLDIRLCIGVSFSVADALERRAIPFAFVTALPDVLPERLSQRPTLDKPVDPAALRRVLTKLQLI